MAAPGVTLVQKFTYRGADEEWSNTYHFLGDAPSTDADWTSLIDALVDIVKAAITPVNHIVRAYGYADTDNDASFVYDIAGVGLGVAGTAATSGSGTSQAPGDCAAWVRWKTDYNNSKGKPVYLRKYFHGVYIYDAGSNIDLLDATLVAAMSDFGTAINGSSGDWPGLSDPHHNAPGVSAVSQYVTTRTLKRRGPRPH